ncbi:hypothetical protein [Sinorhizobium meliloti]
MRETTTMRSSVAPCSSRASIVSAPALAVKLVMTCIIIAVPYVCRPGDVLRG